MGGANCKNHSLWTQGVTSGEKEGGQNGGERRREKQPTEGGKNGVW